MLYPLKNSSGGHISLIAQPNVALKLPPLLSLMPLWPAPFPPRPDEVDPLPNLLIFVVGQAHLLLLCPLMTTTQ
jgi:hypothetical protein